jgi:hypothetical protein
MPDRSELDTPGRRSQPEWLPAAGWSAPELGPEDSGEWEAASWRVDAVTPARRALAERSRSWLQELDARTRRVEERTEELESRLRPSSQAGGGVNPAPRD